MSTNEELKEQIQALEEKLNGIQHQVYDVRSEGERRFGDRRQGCRTDCGAYLSSVQTANEISGTLRVLRWAYSAIGGLYLVISMALAGWVSYQINTLEEHRDEHDLNQVRAITKLNTKVDMMMADHSAIRNQLGLPNNPYRLREEENGKD